MALIDDENIAKRAAYRVKTAGTKLSRTELAAFEEHCGRLATTPGELIRKLIFAELATDLERPTASVELTEVIGLRLMLTNLLKPVATGQRISAETFEGIMAEVKKRKKSVAEETHQDASSAR